jgi:hypothetical protein
MNILKKKTVFILFGVLASIVAVVLIITHGFTSVVAAGTSTTIDIPASQDTYVDETLPTSNFGSATTLRVHYPPSTQNSLLEFNLSVVPSGSVVTQALLKLYVVNVSKQGGVVSSVGGSWKASTVTWNTAPAIGSQIATMPSASTLDTYIQGDITNAVTGNGTYDFYLTTTYSDAVYYSSLEAGSNPPILEVTYSSLITPSPTATGTGSASPTPTPTVSGSPSPSVSPSPSATPTPILTPTPTPTPTVTPTPTATVTPTPTPTSTPSGSGTVIVAAGDIGCALGTTCHAQAVYSLIPPLSPAAILTLGDTQYYCGSATAFTQVFNPSWGQSKSIIHPAVGNHEYLTSGASDCTSANAGAAGYYGYFGSAAGNPSQGYYSYNIGGWHMIALNTQCSSAGGCSSNSPQYKWLQSDLAADTSPCTLAYYHIPLYSVGGRASSNSQPLYNLMYQNGVDVVLTGHDHIYERYVPQDANGNAVANGITEFVVGTGGSNHTSIVSTSPNLVVANATTFGILKMTLYSTSATYQFIPDLTSGKFTDSGTITCH